MKLIVGLGNPGKEYQNTRHNIGFMFADEIANYYGVKFTLDKSKRCEICQFNLNNEKVILIKPITFMNLSGDSVNLVMDYYKIKIEDILVIHDDLDLPVGKMRFKSNTSSGGHNGIKSIIANLKTQDFKRLKVGIDKNGNIIDYVLGNFSKSEMEVINQLIQKGPEIAYDFTSLTFSELMNKYN